MSTGENSQLINPLDNETTRRSFLGKVVSGVAALVIVEPITWAAQSTADTAYQIYKGPSSSSLDCELSRTGPTTDCPEPQPKPVPESQIPSLTEALITAPIKEEALFRAFPSLLVDRIDGLHDDNPNHLLRLSKKEWASGILTSLLFGFSHNVLSGEGFGWNKIPAAQTAMGMGAWRLQRRNGYLANTALHSGHNGITTAIVRSRNRAIRKNNRKFAK